MPCRSLNTANGTPPSCCAINLARNTGSCVTPRTFRLLAAHLRRNFCPGTSHPALAGLCGGNMATFERHVEIDWKGSVMEGGGSVKAGTGAFSLPVSFPRRVGDAQGVTSPEELMAA